MTESDLAESDPTPEGPAPIPLASPAEGVPDLAITTDEIARAAEQLARGHGPFAVDAERASETAEHRAQSTGQAGKTEQPETV